MAFFRPMNETRSIAIDDIPFITGLPIAQGLDGLSYTGVHAINNSDVFSAVQIISSDIASLELEVKVDGVQDENHDLSYLFNIKPNIFYTGYSLKYALTANTLLNGNGYAEVVRDKQGNPIEIYHVANSKISMKQSGNSLFYEIQDGNKTRKVKSENIIHIKFFTVDGLVGVSPLKALQVDLKTSDHAKSFLLDFFRNGTQSGGKLKYKGTLNTQEARNKLRDEWTKANADKKHQVLVLDDTMEYTPLEIDTEVLKLVNTSNYTTQQVAKAFQIPAHKLGISSSNMSLEQMNLDYLTTTLGTYLASIVSELSFKFVSYPFNMTTKLKFNTDRFKETDSKTKVQNVKDKLNMGVLNIDEARAEFGKAPIEGGLGQKHLISLNYTTLDALEQVQLSKSQDLPIPSVVEEDKGGETDDE